jgi:hypothetical protein
MPDESTPSGGRKPPPIEYRFLKGESGNPRGRPRGSISFSKVAQKVALKKVQISYGERKIRQAVLGHVLEVLKREAARGVPSMITELARIHAKLTPAAEEQRGGVLLVPETLTLEEWTAQAEKRNATARDPSLPWEPDSEAEAMAADAQLNRDLTDQ